MSNPTELPDLAACPFCGSTNLSIETNSVQPDDFHDAWVNCGECSADGRHAMTLEGWLPTKAEAKEEAVVAWNRRAQPEGEAPQAEPFGIYVERDDGSTEFQRTGNAFQGTAYGYKAWTLYVGPPAAQHAESGAPAAAPFDPYWIDAIVRDVSELPDRDSPEEWPEAMLVTGDELHNIIVARAPHPEIVPALAAQSQGAPCRACHGIGTYIGQHDGYDDADCSECDGSGKAKGIAQQAAAPGALAELVRLLSEGVDMVAALADAHKAHDADTVRWLGAAGTLVDTLRSAPGTPEAPAGYAIVPLEATESMIYEGGIGRRDQMVDAADVWRQMVRAAQLDGGQGEGASHG